MDFCISVCLPFCISVFIHFCWDLSESVGVIRMESVGWCLGRNRKTKQEAINRYSDVPRCFLYFHIGIQNPRSN